MTTYAYTRVSREDQNLDLQIDAMHAVGVEDEYRPGEAQRREVPPVVHGALEPPEGRRRAGGVEG